MAASHGTPSKSPSIWQAGVLETWIGAGSRKAGAVVTKVAVTGAAVWLTQQGINLSTDPTTTSHLAGLGAEAVVIGLGGAWLLAPAKRWDQFKTAVAIAAVAFAGGFAGDIARPHDVPAAAAGLGGPGN